MSTEPTSHPDLPVSSEGVGHVATGPWEYVPSTEHHGPYVVSEFGSTICDFYTMSKPTCLSTLNGGQSRPVHFMGDYADDHARLTAAAPTMLAALMAIDADWTASFPGGPDGDRNWHGLGVLSDDTVRTWRSIRAAISQATRSEPSK